MLTTPEKKTSTNVSQTSDAQGTLCFRWELLGRWQMWPGSSVNGHQTCHTTRSFSGLPGLLQSFKISLANHLRITELFFPPKDTEQADKEEEVTPTGTLWEYDLAPNLF